MQKLRIGDVGVDNIVILVFGRDKPALCVELLDANAIPDGQRLPLREEECAGIPRLGGGVPELEIVWSGQGTLLFDFLAAEDIRVRVLEKL